MAGTFLFRFTPSVMEAEALEAVFVQREEIVRRILDLTRESTLTSSKHHTLLIGPRGIGKTHGVSLVYHRVKAIEDLREKLLIAWMREEEWGITTLLDLIMRIFRALSAEYKDTGFDERVEALYSLPTDHIETAAGKLLKEYVGDRTLLILIENLDDIFQGLGDEGQKRLRAYIQENPFFTIVATAQSLFNGVSLQTSPFYGFFHIQHLEGLSLEESTQLLASIARYRNDAALESFIRTPTGRARIRAVNHLAGGNHRVYVIFSQFLTHESLDELVEPFLRMLDDLTPYYQDRMRWLSPQQRKIVEFLLNHRSPATVKEISQRCFMTHQTASGQLKVLREMEYVQADQLGRESYYELREPLMRLCVEVKKSRGEPIGLFIDFLRLWYSKDELHQRLAFLKPEAALERKYVLQALEDIDGESEDPRVAACLRDFDSYSQAGDFERALNVTEELHAIKPDGSGWALRFSCLLETERYEESLLAADRALELKPEEPYFLFMKAVALDLLNSDDEALALTERIIRLKPTYRYALGIRSHVLLKQGRWDEALTAYEQTINIEESDVQAWTGRGLVLEGLERIEEAMASFEKAIELNPDNPRALLAQTRILGKLGLWDKALVTSDRAVRLDERNPEAWEYRGVVLAQLARVEEALTAFDRALDLNADVGWTWEVRGFALAILNRDAEAVRSFDEAIKLDPKPSTFLARAYSFMALGRWDEGFAALDNALERYSKVGKIPRDDAGVVVAHLLRTTRDPVIWSTRIVSVIQLYVRHQLEPELGVGLVNAVAELESEMLSDAAARAWRDVWQEVAGDRAEFKVPLRLLDVAVRYRATKDQRVLLELPIEEREILNQVLSLEEEVK